jgi:hypothetical protein
MSRSASHYPLSYLNHWFKRANETPRASALAEKCNGTRMGLEDCNPCAEMPARRSCHHNHDDPQGDSE